MRAEAAGRALSLPCAEVSVMLVVPSNSPVSTVTNAQRCLPRSRVAVSISNFTTPYSPASASVTPRVCNHGGMFAPMLFCILVVLRTTLAQNFLVPEAWQVRHRNFISTGYCECPLTCCRTRRRTPPSRDKFEKG